MLVLAALLALAVSAFACMVHRGQVDRANDPLVEANTIPMTENPTHRSSLGAAADHTVVEQDDAGYLAVTSVDAAAASSVYAVTSAATYAVPMEQTLYSGGRSTPVVYSVLAEPAYHSGRPVSAASAGDHAYASLALDGAEVWAVAQRWLSRSSGCTKSEAHQLLTNAEPGAFLLRPKTGGAGWVLSVRSAQSSPVHFRVSEDDGMFSLLDTGVAEPSFATLKELIVAHLHSGPISTLPASGVALRHCIFPPSAISENVTVINQAYDPTPPPPASGAYVTTVHLNRASAPEQAVPTEGEVATSAHYGMLDQSVRYSQGVEPAEQQQYASLQPAGDLKSADESGRTCGYTAQDGMQCHNPAATESNQCSQHTCGQRGCLNCKSSLAEYCTEHGVGGGGGGTDV